jgi:ATP synthase protein I
MTRNPHPGTGGEPAKNPRPAGRSSDSDYNAGIAVFSYVVGGILVWSLIGWGLDNLLGTRWIVLAGALLGACGGFYLAFAQRRSHSQKPQSKGKPRPEDGNQH